MSDVRTTRQVADSLGVAEWQVRRLFENGDLPEPDKFGGKRAIPASLLPKIVDALCARGWIPEAEAAQ